MPQLPIEPGVWDDIVIMPPWWHQNHRLTGETAGGAWVCTCGNKGRDGAQEAVAVLYNKHLARVKELTKQDAAVYSTQGKGRYRFPLYPYVKIQKRDHHGVGSLFN